MANSLELVDNTDHGQEEKDGIEGGLSEDHGVFSMCSFCCCSRETTAELLQSFWNYGTIIALLAGCVSNISIITCFTYFVFLATLTIWGTRIGSLTFFFEKIMFMFKAFLLTVVISWYIILLCVQDNSNVGKDFTDAFYDLGFRTLSWNEPSRNNWLSYLSFIALFLCCVQFEATRGSNRLYRKVSESNGLKEESFMDQASKSLLSNDSMSKSGATEIGGNLPLSNTDTRNITGYNSFMLPSGIMSKALQLSTPMHKAMFVSLVLLWPCVFPTATILFIPLVLWATLILCLGFTAMFEVLHHKYVLTTVYMYGVLLSFAMFVCEIRSIKYSLGVYKNQSTSSITAWPTVLGLAWRALGGTRILIQSIILILLSWNLRSIRRGKQDDDHEIVAGKPASLKSIVESKEGHTGDNDYGTDTQGGASNDVSSLENLILTEKLSRQVKMYVYLIASTAQSVADIIITSCIDRL